MKKRILSFALCAILCGSVFSGCGAAKTTTSAAATDATVATTDSTAATAATADSTKPDNSKFVTVQMYNFGDPSNDSWKTVMAKVNDYLKTKTDLNCAVNLHYMTWTDWQTKYSVLLASNQPVDFINTASDWLDLWRNAQKGAFMDMTDMLPKYAPDVWKGIPQDVWSKCKYDGKIVAIPENAYTQYVNHGFMYRGDWAKAAGLDNITTWDQMGQYFGWVKANKTGVIPFDISKDFIEGCDGWINSYTTMVPTGVGADVSTWSLKSPTDYTVVSPFYDPTLVEFSTMMKKWADAGYWKTDVANNTDDGTKMLEAGMNGTIEHHVQTFTGEKVTMEKKQPGSNLQMFGFWQPSGILTKLSVTHGASSIGAGAKNPERALQLYNLMYTDKDFYMLFNYGIKDQTYFLNDKGQKYTPDNFDNAKSGYSPDFWGGRLDKFEPVNADSASFYPALKDSLDKIAVPMPADGFAFDQTPVQTQVDAVSQVITSQLPAISLGKVSDPKAAVAKFVASLKAAGLDTVTAEMQKQLDAWKAKQASN